MIRRDWPLGGEVPERWVLIGQPEHARISYELARSWDVSLVPLHVREEFLAAVLHHDDGWIGWSDAPRIDPEHNRPYSFTEMPPAEAEQIWGDSIDACRGIGPLAGWVVASHFSALQSKHDADYPEWVDWLRSVDAQRAEWLAEWLAASEHNTSELADRCLAWLQAFDWMSLWLCLRAPALERDRSSAESLKIGGHTGTGGPPIESTPVQATAGVGGDCRVSPWPFAVPTLRLATQATRVPVQRRQESESKAAGVPESADELIEIAWRLAPA